MTKSLFLIELLVIHIIQTTILIETIDIMLSKSVMFIYFLMFQKFKKLKKTGKKY